MAIAYDKKTPHRFDVVGSFLRPARLKEAREQFEAGKIGTDALKAAEDECILDLIAKEKAAGLGVITDGEFRLRRHRPYAYGRRPAVPRRGGKDR